MKIIFTVFKKNVKIQLYCNTKINNYFLFIVSTKILNVITAAKDHLLLIVVTD